jgi:phage/plasmid-like protein (TIGR03299 family)
MAHNLNMENGKASMMYTGQTPWHGLGKELANPATSSQAIKEANLDWKVTKKRLYAIEGQEILKSDKYGIVREDKWGKDDCKVLGVVSDAYTPVQNSSAFQFFDSIVGSNEAIYHTAGALGNGERIWILAKLPEEMVVKGDDIVQKFLLLANSHDGSLSVQIKFTPIRVVCQNTLTQAINTDTKGVTIPHSRNVHTRLSNAADTLGIIRTRFDDLQTVFKSMAAKQVDRELLKKYHDSVFALPKAIKTKEDESKAKMMEKMKEASRIYFEGGMGNNMACIKGTLWAAYNGITEYIDHRRELNKATDKLNYIWFGVGNSFKVKAYNEAARLISN